MLYELQNDIVEGILVADDSIHQLNGEIFVERIEYVLLDDVVDYYIGVCELGFDLIQYAYCALSGINHKLINLIIKRSLYESPVLSMLSRFPAKAARRFERARIKLKQLKFYIG